MSNQPSGTLESQLQYEIRKKLQARKIKEDKWAWVCHFQGIKSVRLSKMKPLIWHMQRNRGEDDASRLPYLKLSFFLFRKLT